MYQISRSIYRRLAPLVVSEPGDESGVSGRRLVLEACESVMRRMAEDRHYFAHPERTLFADIRSCFSIRDQCVVYSLIEQYVRLADAYLGRLPPNVTAFGEARRCRAMTRQGTPCQRLPLPDRDYCPSHKHLEEPIGRSAAEQELARVA